MAMQESMPYSAKKILSASDVAEILNISRSSAYRLIRRLNTELEKSGKITVAGRLSARYFFEKTYL